MILCLFRGDLLKSSKSKIGIVLNWKRLLIGSEVIYLALRRKGVPEYLVNREMSFYKCCKTIFSVDGGAIKFIFYES